MCRHPSGFSDGDTLDKRTGIYKEYRDYQVIYSYDRVCGKNGVRAVIIAGDMFDGKRIRVRTVNEIVSAMRRTPDIDYLYLAGNHDEAAHAFSDMELPQNFKQFTKKWDTFLYEDVAVSGIEISSDNAVSLYRNVPHKDNYINVVALHGQIGTECGVDRVNLKLLKDRGIDYLALGHIHSYSLEPLDEKGVYCYPGCLEGRGFDECGEKGFMLLTTERGKIVPEFVPFSCRQLHQMPIDITGLAKNAEIAEKIRSVAESFSSDDMVEYILTGCYDPMTDIAVSYLQNLVKGDFFFTKVKNKSRMAIDPDNYKNDISLKGEFIRLVLASDSNDEDKAAIIRIGMEALSGEEIVL